MAIRRKRTGQQFWNKEYQKSASFSLSHEPSEDFEKFCRYLEREHGKKYLNPLCQAVDLGCGNGRNLVFLSETYGFKGYGVDTSNAAIEQARAHAAQKELPLTFAVGSITDPLPVRDHTQTIVIDAMVSHVLKSEQREKMLQEIVRVLRPDGWLFFKTFLLEEDKNAAELLREHPGSEPGSYVHPQIGVEEHVFTKSEIEELLEPYFTIHKTYASHNHLRQGQAYKRRSISVYAQRKS